MTPSVPFHGGSNARSDVRLTVAGDGGSIGVEANRSERLVEELPNLAGKKIITSRTIRKALLNKITPHPHVAGILTKHHTPEASVFDDVRGVRPFLQGRPQPERRWTGGQKVEGLSRVTSQFG